MDPLQNNNSVCPDDRRLASDCRPLKRFLLKAMRSRWLASFIVATAVSFSFSEFDEIQDRKFERQQNVTMCVVKGVANAQVLAPENARIDVNPILERCNEQHGK